METINDNTTSVTTSSPGIGTENIVAPVAAKSSTRARLAEKIRSELNIEKWPAIWQPAKSKNKPALRFMERAMTTQDGNRIVSRVEVGYTQLGTLTTEEQKMLYVLIKLWEDGGKADSQVFFSSRALARMLKKKGWGTNVITAITKSLRKLRTIPIEWINSYYDQTKQGAVLVDRRPFTLLGDLRVVERHQDGAVNSSLGYFKFDDHILTNLQLNYTKPVCIEEFFKLKSEIAQLIYSHVDLMLFDRNRYERRSRELFDDLGLKNAEYNHMYERKRAIEKALRELEGIRLSSGVLRTATIGKTVDGKDYKVSFTKASAAQRLDAPGKEVLETVPAQVTINDYAARKDPLVAQAEELLLHFYKTFHGVENHYAQSKETAQALSRITQHGFECAKHMVEFARTAATSSNYAPQTFGGILQYTSRGLADFDQRQAQKNAPAPKAAQPQVPPPAKKLLKGEARLAALTMAQHEQRFEMARAELTREIPAMARMLQDHIGGINDGSISFKMIRSRIVRQLESQPMELLPLEYLPKWMNRQAQNLGI